MGLTGRNGWSVKQCVHFFCCGGQGHSKLGGRRTHGYMRLLDHSIPVVLCGMMEVVSVFLCATCASVTPVKFMCR